MIKKRRILRTELRSEIPVKRSSEHRFLDCKNYDKCLDKVIKKRWISFSCSLCPIYKDYIKSKINRGFFQNE